MQPDTPPTTTWQQLGAADDDAFELLPDGHVRWRQDDVVLAQVRAGHSVLQPRVQAGAVGAFTATAGFIDIGVPEDYARAQTLFDRPA